MTAHATSPADTHGGAQLRWHPLELALVLLGWAASAVAFAYVAGSTQGTYDTYRDLWFAAGIVAGLEWPLAGPGIYQTFHLGPAWYYLLAGFLLVLPPAGAAATLTGLLVAARFPLAYAAGRALGGRRAGLWALALLAMPGWWLLALGVVTHTAATEAAVLWLVLATIAARRQPLPSRQLWLGLAGGVAIHAHPTTVVLVATAAVLALSKAPRRRLPLAIASLLLPGLLLAAPYLLGGEFAQDLAGIARYAGGVGDTIQPLRVVLLPLAIAAGGPFHAAWIWGGVGQVAALLLAVLPWLLAAAAVVAALRSQAGAHLRRRCTLFALAFCGQCALLVLLRPVTPPWMVFSLAPLLVLAVAPLAAAGFDARSGVRGSLLALVAALALAGTALALAGLTAPHRGSPSWWARYPAGSVGAMSVTEVAVGRIPAGPPLASLLATDALLPTSCDPLQLHGDLALLADRSLGYPWRAACGGSGHVHLGGTAQPEAEQRFALWHPEVLAHCGMDRSATFAGRFQILASGPPLPMADAARYPAREPRGDPVSTRLAPGSALPLLFVGTVLPNAGHLHLQHARANGQPARVLVQHRAFVLLGCGAACAEGADIAWDVAVSAAPGTLDVVALSCPATGA